MRVFVIMVFCLFCFFSNHAQKLRLQYADDLHSFGAYSTAIEGYLDVLEHSSDSLLVSHSIAECYFKSDNLRKAAEWYNYIYKSDTLSKGEVLNLIDTYRILEDYNNSVIWARYYLKHFEPSPKCEAIVNETQDLLQSRVESANFELQNLSLNSSFSDFGGQEFGSSSVLICSNRTNKIQNSSTTGLFNVNFFKLYIGAKGIDLEQNKLEKIKGIPDKFNQGPAVFDSVHNRMFFSCDDNERKNWNNVDIIRSKIYCGKLKGNKVIDIYELPFNSLEYSCSHPSISADGKFLYFSSNMPGGFGGADIYRVHLLDSGKCGEPENLGNIINTDADEYFPFIHPKERLLFFSSNGHFGFGGLDVFVAKLTSNNTVYSIENLGYSINSSRDDFSFLSNDEQSEGYVSSNRLKGKGSDDIYFFIQNSPIKGLPIVKGEIKSFETNLPLSDVKVFIKDSAGVLIDSTFTQDNGQFEVSLKDYKGNFLVESIKDEYEINRELIQSKLNCYEYKYDLELYPNINYHFSSDIIDADSKGNLDSVIVTVVDHDTKVELSTMISTNGKIKSDVIDELEKYQRLHVDVKLQKPGYATVSFSFIDTLDNQAKIDFSNGKPLSLKKIVVGKTDIKEIVSLEPIYFDLNSWSIRSDAAKVLDKVVLVMSDNPGMNIELKSHSDSQGDAGENMRLSNARAKACINYIVSKGIDKSRVVGRGYGESQLLISEKRINAAKTKSEKEKLHQLNRRTDFVIIKM